MASNSSKDLELNLFPAPQKGPKVVRKKLNVAGLFAGIGGIEQGLHQSGHHTSLLCEWDEGAQAVLKKRFGGIKLHGDVSELDAIPKSVDLLTGGFPCQDLSQAGKTAGIIGGNRSSLVGEIFRLITKSKTPWVLLENVPFMLKLDKGRAMTVLTDAFEKLGYNWAYRVVDSMAFGVPQRRERVVFLASLQFDPREVLFGAEAEPTNYGEELVGKVDCGFYWTEGIRGLGLAPNGVPPIKGGSTVGIASPPAILFKDGNVATPDIRDAERMQGFPENWTLPSNKINKESHRWKLVGNAVTTCVFRWVGKNLINPNYAGRNINGRPIVNGKGWPNAGWNVGAGRFGTNMSTYPILKEYKPLSEWLKYPAKPLSVRAINGFLKRASSGSLRFPPGFIHQLEKFRVKIS